jgi:hypothetical protein
MTLFLNLYVKSDIVLILLFIVDQPRRGGSMVEGMFITKEIKPRGVTDLFFDGGLQQRAPSPTEVASQHG